MHQLTARSKQRYTPNVFAAAWCCLVVIISIASRLSAADLLPDLYVSPASLEDHVIVQNVSPGRIHLRLSTGVANLGSGPLYLRADALQAEGGEQPVYQRIYDDGGGFSERQAGVFVYHPSHGHIHFANWTQLRLRQILPGDGVGPIIAQGSKVTFCIVDEDVFNSSLPNFDQDGRFFQCGATSTSDVVQGISVGWIDTYDKSLPDQTIDITEVPIGTYWLEAEVDPLHLIEESDESNNVSRIKYQLAQNGWDSYEPNDYASAIAAKPFGVDQSPNLGPCAPERVIQDLNLHDGNDIDHFRFYMNSTGTVSDFIEVSFVGSSANLGLQLLDSTYTILKGSISGIDRKVSLIGYPRGWYFARVYSLNGQKNTGYELTIHPPSNLPPSIVVTAPTPGAWVHDGDLYDAKWKVTDPDDSLTWVSIFVDTLAILNGDEFELPQSHLTPGSLDFHEINTAHLNPGSYFVYAQVTDGGSVAGSWSSAPLEVVTPSCCERRGDLDGNGAAQNDIADLVTLVNHLFIDYSPLRCPQEAELDGVPGVDIGDLLVMVDNLFVSFAPLPPCN